LAISSQLVELMGGYIGLESQPGQGSCFWFEVPFDSVKGDSSEAVPRAITACRALVVGLAPLVRDALCQQLEVMGCHSTSVAEGQAALDSVAEAKAVNAPFDYIFVDERLTEIEPALLAQRLRSECGAERVLISQALAITQAPLHRKEGFDRVIFRPLHLDSLLGAMRTITSVATAGAPPKQAPGAASPARRNLRLLLAEDSPANQMVATALLRGAGYQVDVANNGHEAVEAFQRGNYDLILMDMRMPEMDGIEATEVIRASGSAGQQIPILAMSANALQSDVDRCLAAGMNDYVTKPVAKENLLDAIQTALGGEAARASEERHPMFDYNQPILDEEALTRLAADTSSEQVPSMLNIFLEEGRMRTDSIGNALQEHDFPAMGEEAHVLKSLSGTFGALRLQAVARALEQMIREGRSEQAAALANELIGIFTETETAYQKHVNGVHA
jgi:CheY-like chemotaxis protein/HPt (histidine-containing phosphotransfer) domain-containing protein